MRRLQCYHCRHRFDVSTRARSSSCPRCSKPLHLDDVVVKGLHQVRRVQTCGKVVVEKKGRLVASFIEAHGGVVCEGELDGSVISGALVTIGKKARWRGDCKAPSLRIEGGSTIAGGYFVIPDDILAPTAAEIAAGLAP